MNLLVGKFVSIDLFQWPSKKRSKITANGISSQHFFISGRDGPTDASSHSRPSAGWWIGLPHVQVRSDPIYVTLWLNHGRSTILTTAIGSETKGSLIMIQYRVTIYSCPISREKSIWGVLMLLRIRQCEGLKTLEAGYGKEQPILFLPVGTNEPTNPEKQLNLRLKIHTSIWVTEIGEFAKH